MTRNAIGSLKPARRSIAGCALLGLLASATAPAAAQNVVTDEDVSVKDVMLTPLADLNLARDPIPEVLVRAFALPYDDTGLMNCHAVREEIGNLDAVLGEDLDTGEQTRTPSSIEGMAQGVVTGFIPFRGVIRHLSGAKKHEWEFRAAITAGLVRRAYLKGLGQGMGCAYPARPAPPGLLVSAGTE